MGKGTWHERLALALEKRGKDYPDLYAYLNAKTGITKQSLYAWKADASRRSGMMNGDNAAHVCEYLGIRALWLFDAEGVSGLESAPSQSMAVRPDQLKLLEDIADIAALSPSHAKGIIDDITVKGQEAREAIDRIRRQENPSERSGIRRG